MQIQINDEAIQAVIHKDEQKIATSCVLQFFNYGGEQKIADIVRGRLNVFMETELTALIDAEIRGQIKGRLSELVTRRLDLRVNKLTTERAKTMFQQLEMEMKQ